VTPNYLKLPHFRQSSTEQIELVFGTEAASFGLFYTVLGGNSGISKTKLTFL